MKRFFILMMMAGALLSLTGCDLNPFSGVRERAKSKADQLLENANINSADLANRAANIAQQADDKKSLLPTININASVEKTPPPEPQF